LVFIKSASQPPHTPFTILGVSSTSRSSRFVRLNTRYILLRGWYAPNLIKYCSVDYSLFFFFVRSFRRYPARFVCHPPPPLPPRSSVSCNICICMVIVDIIATARSFSPLSPDLIFARGIEAASSRKTRSLFPSITFDHPKRLCGPQQVFSVLRPSRRNQRQDGQGRSVTSAVND